MFFVDDSPTATINPNPGRTSTRYELSPWQLSFVM
jgi:hypothetical protein